MRRAGPPGWIQTPPSNADNHAVTTRAQRPVRRGRAALLGAAAALLAAAPSAHAAPAPPGSDGLSARLARLASPSLRSASRARQSRALGLPRSGAGSLLRHRGRVVVEARFEEGAAAAVPALEAAGAGVIDVSRRYQTVTAAIAPADLRRLAAVRRVASVSEVLRPLAFAEGEEECPSGKVVSEGLEQLRVDDARELFPTIDGSGVEVGILSDSFDQATEGADGSKPVAAREKDDVDSGDLPGLGNPCGDTTKVDVLEEFKPGPGEEGGLDEGRGMGQIVHDLAPGADLSFASAFNGPEAFAENIGKLVEAGADVIADDVVYLEEPFFQVGPIGVAAREATEKGAVYLSAGGNDNLIDGRGRDVASWEAPRFRDSGSCPPAVVSFSRAVQELEREEEEKTGEPRPGLGLNASHCMDFDPSGAGVDTTFGINVEAEEVLIVDLQWAEPWNGVGTDLDALLLGPGGQLIEQEEAFGAADNIGQGRPLEILAWENNTGRDTTVQLVVNRYSGGDPRLKFILLQNGGGVSGTEYPESRGGDIVGPAIFGHSGDPATIGVGAVPFNDSAEPEPYSSRGPVTHYFGPVSGTTPAAPLPSPRVISKPDLAATDCGATTFFAFLDLETWRFCGTSAAAPHAAAVAALALDAAEEGATPGQIRAAEVNGAVPVGAFGPCAVGGGLVDAVATIEGIQGEPGPQPAPCVPPESPPIPEPSPPVTSSVVPSPRVPGTRFRRHPRKLLRTKRRTAKAVFVFSSDEEEAGFECRVDRDRFRTCPRRFVGRFRAGGHVLRVRAVVAATGARDASPAAFRFRVKRVRRRSRAGSAASTRPGGASRGARR